MYLLTIWHYFFSDTYFFRGPRFWRFDNTIIAAHEFYPVPTAQIWFPCPPTDETILFIDNEDWKYTTKKKMVMTAVNRRKWQLWQIELKSTYSQYTVWGVYNWRNLCLLFLCFSSYSLISIKHVSKKKIMNIV